MHLRKPSPGTAIALLALFFAMGGTALAAHHYLITKTSQIKPSVLKSLKGNTGKAGPAGAAGATGAQGLQGPQGKEGPPNPNAINASHASTADTATVANGQGTLASGQTETGVFAGRGESTFQDISISFPIPLSASPAVTVTSSGTTTTDCAGSATAPSAAAGHLCVYVVLNSTATPPEPVDPAQAKSEASSRFGLYLFLAGTKGADNDAYGTWAVTAP